MNRTEILDAARQAITVDRAATHGEADQFCAMFGAMLSLRLGVEVTKSQACIIMVDLKSIRAWFNPGHADNWVDIAGWGSLGGELAEPVPTEWTDAMVEAMVDAPVNRAAQTVGTMGPRVGQFQPKVNTGAGWHMSDCATHNAPAYPAGPCDCGGYNLEAQLQRRGECDV